MRFCPTFASRVSLSFLARQISGCPHLFFDAESGDSATETDEMANLVRSVSKMGTEKIEAVNAEEESGGLTCKTAPGVTFATRQELAEHCRSDWHRLNLKRIAAGQPPIAEGEFQAAADDLSSLSGSASEVDEDADEDDQDEAALKDLYAAQHAPSARRHTAADDDDDGAAPARAAPLVAVEGPGVKGRVGVWRVLLPHGWGEEPAAGADCGLLGPALLPLKRGRVVYLFASGGHFAAGVFQGAACLQVRHAATPRCHPCRRPAPPPAILAASCQFLEAPQPPAQNGPVARPSPRIAQCRKSADCLVRLGSAETRVGLSPACWKRKGREGERVFVQAECNRRADPARRRRSTRPSTAT
jgi:hypothetical protein